MRICITCNSEFAPSSRHKKCPSCRHKTKKIPCPLCKKLMRPESIQCQNCRPPQKFLGELNSRWKGGRFNQDGYVKILFPEHPRVQNKSNNYIFEHILVMEEKLGRFLFDGETIHHLNGVRDDNRIENLELWAFRQQPSGQRVEDLADWAEEILSRYRPERLK